jgi:hypothetical protein
MADLTVGAPSPSAPNPAPVASNEPANDNGAGADDLGNFHGAAPANDNAGTEAAPGIPTIVDAKNLGALGALKIKGVVVNGEEKELTLAEALKNGRLGTAALKKFDEAKTLRDEAERKETQLRGIVQQAAESPLDFIRRLGPKSVEKLYTQLHEELRRESLPEPERKALSLEERERAIAEREKRTQEQEQKRQKAEQERQNEAQATQARHQILTQMVGVMDKAGFAPVAGDEKSRARAERQRAECVERMATRLDHAYRVGHQLTIAEAFEDARDEMRSIASGLVSGLDANALAELLGDQKIGELRQREIARVRGEQAPAAPVPKPPGTQARPKPRQAPPSPDIDRTSPGNFSAWLTAQARGR